MPWRSRVSTGATKPKRINKREQKARERGSSKEREREREEAIRYFTGGRTHGCGIVKNSSL
jgi:hypothetical protein